MAKLSKRAEQALILMLEQGAYWAEKLERQYRGGEVFKFRLRGRGGLLYRGFGFQTAHELLKAGLMRKDLNSYTSVGWHYKMVAQ